MQEPYAPAESGASARHWMRALFVALACLVTAYQLYVAAFGGSMTPLVARSLHVGLILTLLFVSVDWKGRNRISAAGSTSGASLFVDAALAGLSILVCVYAAYNWQRFLMETYSFPARATALDLTFAATLLILIFEASRRFASMAFAWITIVVLLYALYGDYLPGVFAINPFTPREILVQLYMSTVGFWGDITGVSAVEIATLVLFAGMLTSLGGLAFMRNASVLMAGRTTGGAGKVAVIMSALFGMISGSSAANVASVGSFTIPMMMRQGYRPAFAGGLEAASSTFGQLMPPIMGTGAFIMAELLGVSYGRIMAAAIMPSLAIYVAIYFATHFYAAKTGLGGLPEAVVAEARAALTLKSALQFLVPLGVLAVFLAVGRSVPTAAFYAYIATLVTYLALNFRQPVSTLWSELAAGVTAGVQGLVAVAVLIIAAQTMVTIVNLTSLGITFTTITTQTVTSPLMLALMTAVATLVLGMGLPTTAAYVIGASVCVPVLQAAGIAPIAAQMFVFFFAILSAITPPVCVAVYVAAGIAQTNWLHVASECIRISLMKYLLPFLLLYNTSLLVEGSLYASLLSLGGLLIIGVTLEALCFAYLFTRLSVAEAACGIASCALLTFATMMAFREESLLIAAAALAGLAGAATMGGLNFHRSRKVKRDHTQSALA